MDHTEYRYALAEQMHQAELAFVDSEYVSRCQRTRKAMHEAGLDALLITDPADIYYLTGYNTFEVSVHTCLVFTENKAVLQVPSIETGPAVVTACVSDILGYRWEGIEEVIEPLCDALAPYSAVGIDSWSPTLRQGVIQRLQARLGASRFHEAGELLDKVRIIKSPAELACLRESARITATGMEAAIASVEAGAYDNDIAAEGARAMLAAGSEFMSMQPIVTVGRRSSVIHMNHQRHRIEAGDPVFLEFGSSYKRYTAPMMCTAIAGRAKPRMWELRDVCRDVFEALTGAMRPGKSFDDAARAGETALAPVKDQVFFSGVFGYAVGAQFPPSWVEGSGYIARRENRHFEIGMVFHLPLCLRIPGLWGIGLSDSVEVTAEGARPITANNWQLQERIQEMHD